LKKIPEWNNLSGFLGLIIPIRYSIMWALASEDEWDRRLKRFEKKRPRELAAALDNLDTFHKTLNNGVKSREAKFGFIHPEPLGVLAIDQKGGGPNLAQIRRDCSDATGAYPWFGPRNTGKGGSGHHSITFGLPLFGGGLFQSLGDVNRAQVARQRRYSLDSALRLSGREE